MLIKKLFRTAWKYKAQFISMIIMIAIGVGVFLDFNIEWKSMKTGIFVAGVLFGTAGIKAFASKDAKKGYHDR